MRAEIRTASCTTIHYKSATRAHIESLGYDIVANFGYQFSDLKGGFADTHVQAAEPELLPAVGADGPRVSDPPPGLAA